MVGLLTFFLNPLEARRRKGTKLGKPGAFGGGWASSSLSSCTAVKGIGLVKERWGDNLTLQKHEKPQEKPVVQLARIEHD